jgi:squalene cyclase
LTRDPTSASRTAAVRAAAAKGVQWLQQQQRDDGSWWLDVQMAPTVSALAQLVMVQLGYAGPDDGERFHRWVVTQANADGSFADNFPAGRDAPAAGGLRATAAVWGALKVSGFGDTHPTVQRAWAFIDAHGGLEAIGKMPMGEDAFSVGPLLAYADLLDPDTLSLRHFPLFQTLIPFANEAMARLVNVGFIYTEQLLAGLVTSLCEGGMRGPVRSLERARVEKLALRFQNDNGSWNDTVNQTLLSMAALHAMGMPVDAEPLQRAAAWVRSSARGDDEQLHYLPIGSAVWDSSLALEALMSAGVAVDEPSLTRGVRWLVDAQLMEDMPAIDAPQDDAPRRGGFAFEDDNSTMPDCDDTGLVLGALGRWQDFAAVSNHHEALVDDVRACIRRGLSWLEGMQHTDGGWGAYMSDQPRRPRGALFARPILDLSGLDWREPKAVLQFLQTTMIEAADVSTAGLTGRVLHGVAVAGPKLTTPGVRSAVDFLFEQQLDGGRWFGRWVVNYCAGTAWALKGLGAAGVARDDPHVVAAVDWLRSVQNDDGGFGETPASYTDARQAGRGPSMPGLTGLVLCGLQRAGFGADPMVLRGIDYLVASMNDEGTWDNAGWQHVWFPPVYFYVLPSADHTYPLEALGRFLETLDGRDPAARDDALLHVRLARADDPVGFDPRTADGGWSPQGLRAWRARGDAAADAFVEATFAKHERGAINALFRLLVHNDDPMPDGVDPAVAAWFTSEGRLPSWADEAKLERAHQFYEREGWKIAFGLFCGALPQTYACANGARVLGQTQQLTQHTRRRILETAQFIFDVMEPGAFTGSGRGIRTTQKIRLLHTAIRHFTLRDASWDLEAWGVPINQEDMAGTVMTFSAVILDVIDAMGDKVDPDDAEAYLHLWCCVGHLLGLEPSLMPHDRADADALMQAMRDDQWAPSPYGHQLAEQLCASMGDYLVVPGGERFAASLIRSVSGDECADLLGLADDQFEVEAARFTMDLFGRLTSAGRQRVKATLFERVATRFMQALVAVQREGKEAPFRLPDSLLHGWGMKRRWWR